MSTPIAKSSSAISLGKTLLPSSSLETSSAICVGMRGMTHRHVRLQRTYLTYPPLFNPGQISSPLIYRASQSEVVRHLNLLQLSWSSEERASAKAHICLKKENLHKETIFFRYRMTMKDLHKWLLCLGPLLMHLLWLSDLRGPSS